MPHPTKLSLKAFWEAVEKKLAAYSSDALRDILRGMAQETPPAGRPTFLEKLTPMADTRAAARQAMRQEKLLAEIDEVTREIKARRKHAEEYDEWYDQDDYYDDYGGGHYDDEDGLGPYEEFIEPLSRLFDRAQAAFDYGKLKLARKAYEKLFAVLNLEDDYGRGISADDLEEVDIGEAHARYLRAVYETEPSERRPQTLFEQMQKLVPYPTLNDLLQISTQPLPDYDQFLEDWIAFLRKQKGKQADAGLREAIRLARGTQGLAELARTAGKKRPRAYLDWVAALEEEKKPHEVIAAAHAALQALAPRQPLRAAIADHLCQAAKELNDAELLRAGRWEAFLVAPTLARLLDLWDAAPTPEVRAQLMQQAAEHVKDYLAHPPRESKTFEPFWEADNLEAPVWIDKSVLAHAHLLSGELEEARQLAAREESLGWSYGDNPQGLVEAFLLVLLSGKSLDKLPSHLAQVWKSGLDYSIGFGEWGAEDKTEKSIRKRLEGAYDERLGATALSEKKQAEFLDWCLDVARQRVNAIVEGQHRQSYNKAAVLLGACAQALRARGREQDANTFVDEMRNRYPRHRAFQSELNAVAPPRKASK
ncbi:MAG: hypothetical protein HY741_17520 [Chloroflexi bacterium]|nr:hypothetical protein [Chloroflexota bacterium]